MPKCPIVETFMDHVVDANKTAWNLEMNTLEPTTRDTRVDDAVENKRGLHCFDWSARQVLPDLLLRMRCTATAARLAALPAATDEETASALASALQPFAEGEQDALTDAERATLTPENWNRIVAVAGAAMGSKSALDQALHLQSEGRPDAEVRGQWDTMTGYAVEGLVTAESVLMRPGPAVTEFVLIQS